MTQYFQGMHIHCLHDRVIPLAELREHPKNRNAHSEEQIARLALILDVAGWRSPVVISKRSGFIVAGHGRRLAAIKNGWTDCPVQYQDFESDDAEYQHLQADNAIAAWAELDLDGIRADIAGLDPTFDLDLLGIKDFKIGVELVPQCDEDEVPENVPPRTKRGDIYQMGRHRLMCGDSTMIDDVEKLMAGEKADLWLTDPPYGVNYQEKNAAVHGGIVHNQARQDGIASDNKTLDEIKPLWKDAAISALLVCSDKSAYYWFACQGGDQMMMMMMMMLGEAGWKVRHELIWVKSSMVFGRCDYHYQHEPIIYGWKTKGTHEWYSDRRQTSVLNYDRPHRSDDHPTMKPVELIEYLMGNSTIPGHIVLDTFGGSGTTMIAAEKSGRISRLMELSPRYCDVIVARWEKYTGNKAEILDAKAL